MWLNDIGPIWRNEKNPHKSAWKMTVWVRGMKLRKNKHTHTGTAVPCGCHKRIHKEAGGQHSLILSGTLEAEAGGPRVLGHPRGYMVCSGVMPVV